MTLTDTSIAIAHRPEDLLAPVWAQITDITTETKDTATYWLKFDDEALAKDYRFGPGQFNMLYVPGYGEAAISISSDTEKPNPIAHPVRFMGNVTQAISRLQVGDRGAVGRSAVGRLAFESEIDQFA